MPAYHQVNEESGSGRPSMQSDQTDGIAAHLGGLAAAGGSSERVADSVGSTLLGIEQALSPIVGPRGVAAIYTRSLHLSKQGFAWLPDASTSAAMAGDVGTLTRVLVGRTPAEAALAGARVLGEFHALMTTLIGTSLTERLLRSVWAPFLSSPPAQDNTQ